VALEATKKIPLEIDRTWDSMAGDEKKGEGCETMEESWGDCTKNYCQTFGKAKTNAALSLKQ
jgi:hypothetical protein